MNTVILRTTARVAAGACLSALMFSAPTHAQDACKVVLCLAGNWKAIQECRPPVERALRRLAQGHPMEPCDLSSSPGNDVRNGFVSRADCPDFYQQFGDGPNGPRYLGCRYANAISVRINGQPWSDIFWDYSGNTSTRYSPHARASLGRDIDPTYDIDAAAWVPPPPQDPPQ